MYKINIVIIIDVWVRYAVTLNNQYANDGDVQIFPKNVGHINVRVLTT
jgi:hypothetical protein